jgi:hypothetical protein
VETSTASRKVGKNQGPTIPSKIVVNPPCAKTDVARAVASVTTVFCPCDSGSQGSMYPRATNPKKASPSTRALGSNRSATERATADFPAPGGPVMINSSDTVASSQAHVVRDARR